LKVLSQKYLFLKNQRTIIKNTIARIVFHANGVLMTDAAVVWVQRDAKKTIDSAPQEIMMKSDLEKIYSEAINSVDPYKAVKSFLHRSGNSLILKTKNSEIKYNLNEYKSLYIVGAGKATSPMAVAIEELCLDFITEGIISVKYGYTSDLKKIETKEAAHPIPDESGQKNAAAIVKLLERATEKDLIISLISGGGSALLPLPPKGISLKEKGETTDLLLKSGASIHEINAVRKHLSMVKGGQLAKKAAPATIINLMISDVVGDNMDVIASGPFVPDNSSFNNALNILKKYNIYDRAPLSVKKYIYNGAKGNGDETPDKESDIFKKITNLIVSSNIIACEAASRAAKKLGYNTIILSSLIEGNTTASAQFHCSIAEEILLSGNPIAKPACILSGGETTVEIHGHGLGGRNMEFALQCAKRISGTSITAASIGTDGSDGPTDAAGAFSDGDTMKRAQSATVDIESYMSNNDSYHFFEQIGDLIKTGPTNTNVMDIRILLIS
jgi:glycerate 2-kinase